MDDESVDSFTTANEEEDEDDAEQAKNGCTSTTMMIGQVVMIDSANDKSAVTTTNTTSSLTLLNLAAQQEATNQSIIKENNMLHKRLLEGAVSTTPKIIMGGSGAKDHNMEIINNRELVEQNKAYRKRLSQIQSPIKQYKIESEKKVEQRRKDLQEKRHRDSE
jgi:hypothetical protein